MRLFINADKRRLRAHQFGTVTGIPYPRVRNALLMAAYSTKTPSTSIHMVSPYDVRQLADPSWSGLRTVCTA